MNDLALDPSETRATRRPEARPERSSHLRLVLFGLVGAAALGGFGIAASTLMAQLAAPAPVKVVSSGRAADWPELKDGLPAVTGTRQVATAAATPSEPAAPALRMAALPGSFTPAAAPVKSAAAPMPPPAQAAAAPETPTQRIPQPTPVVPVAPRQVVPIPPSRTAALLAPRASETVRARELAEPTAPPAPKPIATATPAASTAAPEKAEKPARKAVATHKAPAPVKTAETTKGAAPTPVAQAEAAEPEETEVLGIKLPSLAPAGRKLKESVDALGDAVKKVF
ncbi:hypothetical protein ACRAWG_01860 [Methylobacterium sp. P31]